MTSAALEREITVFSTEMSIHSPCHGFTCLILIFESGFECHQTRLAHLTLTLFS